MMDRSLLYAWAVTLGACQANHQQAAPGQSQSAPVPSIDASPATPVTRAQEALDKLDSRTPLPLLPMMAQHQKQNMRDHLAVVQEVVSALARKDFAAIEKSAARMGYSETMGQMCTHMGAGAPGFTETALAFHHTADKIGAAASHHDQNGVVAALSETLSACASCHATYKQRVVDDDGAGL